MEKLNLEQCITIINDGASLSIEANNHVFVVQASIITNDIEVKKQILGYTVYIGSKIDENEVFRTQEELVTFVKDNNFIVDGMLSVVNIDGKFTTLEEYLEEVAFQKLNMKEILDLYPNATVFSLTMPYGYFYVPKNQANEILDSSRRFISRFIEDFYERYLSDKEKEKLPSLEKIVLEVSQEIEYFKITNRDSDILDIIGSDGATKYTTPLEFFFRLYQVLEIQYEIEKNLDSLVACDIPPEIFEVLDIKEFEVLKNNFDHVELSYMWHCSTAKELQKTFFFKLNEETKAWLLQYKTDYEFDTLSDLGLYEEDDLLFSSYTKGKVHFDTSK